MQLEKIKQIELEMRVLEARLAPCLNQEARFALQDTCWILAEVRHFAVCWDQVETDLKEGRDPERCRDEREEAITRLVNAFRP
jgi:hypothetical protein